MYCYAAINIFIKIFDVLIFLSYTAHACSDTAAPHNSGGELFLSKEIGEKVVICIFFAQEKYSRSFVKLWLM